LLIDNFLYPLADKKYDLIKEKLNIDETTLTKYIDIIKSLNPIPSRGYNIGKIRKIIKIVLRKQKDFFITEGKKMNVLKISEIASELDLSSSTVSRAIKEKYIKSDFGIISLRKLFNLSSTIFLCQEKIAQYIENEDRKKPYSDQDIVKLLENDSIKIARRTVSKYRIDLGYKSSSERKRSF